MTEPEPAASRFWTAQRDLLGDRFPGRREQILALQLAVLSGEHAFLLGPPGTGKTSLVRAFAATLGGRLFEQTLSRTRPDAAVLGPFDIPSLRDHGRFQRSIEGYLLDCEWAFLDEIGHISPELGHDLLAALGDRVRHDVAVGRSIHPIPLRTAFTAGNEIPGDDGAHDARALWDRLLVRVPVDYLGRADAATLLSGPQPDVSAFPPHGLAALDADRAAVDATALEPAVVETVLDLRDRLREHGDVFSDRRWRAALRVCRAHAWLEGRDAVSGHDLASLRFVLWDSIGQRERTVREIALVSDPVLAEALVLVERARLLAEVCRARRGDDPPARQRWVREARRKHRALAEAARELPAAVGWDGVDTDTAGALADAARAITELEPSDPQAPHVVTSGQAPRRGPARRAGVVS